MAETIGVDLGGAKMLVGVLDSERRIVYRSSAPSVGLGQDELLSTLERELRQALEVRPEATAAGLGIPCTIDRERGVAIMAVNLELADVPIRELMTERLGMPVAMVTGLAQNLKITTPEDLRTARAWVRPRRRA